MLYDRADRDARGRRGVMRARSLRKSASHLFIYPEAFVLWELNKTRYAAFVERLQAIASGADAVSEALVQTVRALDAAATEGRVQAFYRPPRVKIYRN